MPQRQLSIRKLLGLVALFAVACAALARPSFLWAGTLWTLTMAVLGIALVGTFCSRDRTQAFWFGFSVFGWGHMILALAPWFDGHSGEFIITRQLLDRLGHLLGHEVAELGTMPGIWHNLSWASTGGSYTYLTYLVAGQSVLTLVVALVGGLAAQRFYSIRPGD